MTMPVWTPPPRPGIIPLHPLGFGTILGTSFAALRQNPRVLLGFALVVQLGAYLVVTAVVGITAFNALGRLATVTPESVDFATIFDGSVALTIVVSVVLGLAATALTVIVQGVVVAEVAHAAVAERRRLRDLWQQVRPVAWRLIGYALLLSVATLLLIGVVVAIIVAVASAVLPIGIGLTIVAILAAIPLSLWLSVKLLLVPSVMILEREPMWPAVARSWRLTRGRFWPTLGIVVVIAVAFGVAAQVVSMPVTLLGSVLTTIVAPTGAPDAQALVGVIVTTGIAQVLVLLLQAVQLIVSATASALIYIDSRMRREGLDADLQEHVEQRDAGATDLSDPYRRHAGREVAPRPPFVPAGHAPPTGVVPAPPAPPSDPAAPEGPADPTRWAAPGDGPRR